MNGEDARGTSEFPHLFGDRQHSLRGQWTCLIITRLHNKAGIQTPVAVPRFNVRVYLPPSLDRDHRGQLLVAGRPYGILILIFLNFLVQ